MALNVLNLILCISPRSYFKVMFWFFDNCLSQTRKILFPAYFVNHASFSDLHLSKFRHPYEPILDLLIFIQKIDGVNSIFEINIFSSCCQMGLIERDDCIGRPNGPTRILVMTLIHGLSVLEGAQGPRKYLFLLKLNYNE